MILHFNRFDANGNKKFDFITFPTENLNISQFVLINSDENHSYDLNSIVIHIGNSTASGHYITCCKNAHDNT